MSLYHLPEWDRVLPQAFIVPVNEDGTMSYYKALARKDILAGYGLSDLSDYVKKALGLVEELSTPAVENYFLKNKKKGFSLTNLFADKEQKKYFARYIDSRMHSLLSLCQQHAIDVCWNLQRKMTFEEYRMAFLPVSASTVMYFDKTITGISYRLNLVIGDKPYRPIDIKLTLLNENPAWVASDNKIFQVHDVNGVRLKPFLKKESIFIPADLTRDFFEKFVLENLYQVQVETTGFDLAEINSLTGVRLETRDAFMDNQIVLDLLFSYGEITFSHRDKARYRNKLKVSVQHDVSVQHVKRNSEEESTYVKKLIELGFRDNGNGFFTRDDTRFGVLHRLAKVADKLAEFQLAGLEAEGKKLNFSESSWQIQTRRDFDWFDVFGTLRLGDKEIPFDRLLPYIKENNIFFPLGDGTFGIIPEEMMSKLQEMVLFSKWDGKVLRIHKSQHKLLEFAADLGAWEEAGNKLLQPADIQYTPGPNLKASLRPYQMQGVKWLISHRENGLGCLLADDMGLGKTLQVIALLVHVKDKLRNTPGIQLAPGIQLDLFAPPERIYQPVKALVILPASLVFNWQQELTRFAPFLHVVAYTGAKRKNLSSTLSSFDVILTTYKTAVLDIDNLRKHRFEIAVLDESQTIKNKDSQTFKWLSTLDANQKISLSGTPIENSLRELWAQMQFINPDVLGTFSFFEKNFLLPIQKNGDENKKQVLRDIISPYLLRRTKFQVAPDLPELSRQIHYSEMDEAQAKRFEKEKSAVRNAILDAGGKIAVPKHKVLVSLLRLRQIANHPGLVDPTYDGLSGKMEDVKNEIITLQEAGHKVLIFSAFTSVLDMLTKWSDEQGISYRILTGQQSAAERKNAVETYQNDVSVTVFYLSLKAGGVGLNLTAADYIFILDPWWNPFIEFQAEARAHRIGQNRPVFVKKFISKGSIEEKILILQEKKKALAADLVLEDINLSLSDEDVEILLGSDII